MAANKMPTHIKRSGVAFTKVSEMLRIFRVSHTTLMNYYRPTVKIYGGVMYLPTSVIETFDELREGRNSKSKVMTKPIYYHSMTISHWLRKRRGEEVGNS